MLEIVVSIVGSALSILATIWFTLHASRSYSSIWSNIDHVIMEIIKKRLDDKSLRNAAQVQALIGNVAEEYCVQMPTTKHVVGLLRRIALTYERQDGDFKHILRKLEAIRKELEPKGVPLASIAATNRMTASQLFIFSLLLSTIGGLVAYIFLAATIQWIFIILFLTIECLLVLVAAQIARQVKRILKSTLAHEKID